MLKFVFHKFIHKKWMMLALLLGNALLIGVTVCYPLYTHAARQWMLTRNFSDKLARDNVHPGLATVLLQGNEATAEGVISHGERVRDIPRVMGIAAVIQITCFWLNPSTAEPAFERDGSKNVKLGPAVLSGLDGHIRLTSGRMYAGAPDPDGLVEAVVSESCLYTNNLLVDEIITLPQWSGPDGEPLRVRVVGVFTNSDPEDVYWVQPPDKYTSELFLPESVFADYFLNAPQPPFPMNACFYTLLDYTAMRENDAGRLLSVAQTLPKKFTGVYSDQFSDVLSDFSRQAQKMDVTLLILQIPIFMLLIAFIFSLSRQTLETEQNEMSVLQGRGASRRQILVVYLMQSVLLACMGLLIGLPLGVFMSRMLGSTNAFLEFVNRRSFHPEFGGEAVYFGLAAAALAVGMMTLPIFGFTKGSIVTHKQRNHRRSSAWWRKGLLDAVLLGAALYELYIFNQQREAIAVRVIEGSLPDPLMFLSPSLFIIGVGLAALRILPIVAWLIYRLFANLWSPALTASFLQIIRARTNRGFITVFLILTVALGLFNARAARTISADWADNLRYTIGADVVVQEIWPSDITLDIDNIGYPVIYNEPDYGKYETLTGQGIESITKVLVRNNCTVQLTSGILDGVKVMGIHTKEFGQTVWFRNGLLPEHINHYLNVMSRDARSVLVSKNFQTVYGYSLGDVIRYKNRQGEPTHGVICGFVGYWPSYEPVTRVRGEDGVYTEQPQFLIAAHLSLLQSEWSLSPYQIWMKVPGPTVAVYDFAERTNTSFVTFQDTSVLLAEQRQNPTLQGTNGLLTMAFVLVLLLCAVGFLFYWILSIRSRALHFSIFRAMGLSVREIIVMLLNEQLFISGLAVVVGAAVGYLASKLYIPMIQIAYATIDQALPTAVIADKTDTGRLLGIVGAMILVCMGILAGIIRSMKIAQTLKLGEE